MHVHLYEIQSGMKQGVKKKNVKKSKRKKALPEKKGGYLRHQCFKNISCFLKKKCIFYTIYNKNIK